MSTAIMVFVKFLSFALLIFVGTASFLTGCIDQGIKVDGKFGEPVKVSIGTVVKVKEPNGKVIDKGDGPELKNGDLISFHIAYFNGTTGQRLKPGEFGTGRGILTYTIGSGVRGFSYLDKVLQKVPVKSRVLAEIPGGELWNADSRPEEVNEHDNAVAIIDVLSVVNTKLSGPTRPLPEGLPAVVDSPNGPSIVPVKTAPPKNLAVYTLIEGSGDEVKPDDKVVVNYVGAMWDGKVFDSSWSRNAPAEFVLSSLIKGFKDGLTRVKVGSRVLLIIPPELGYGSSRQGSIPGNSTLIFVVDLLMTLSKS